MLMRSINNSTRIRGVLATTMCLALGSRVLAPCALAQGTAVSGTVAPTATQNVTQGTTLGAESATAVLQGLLAGTDAPLTLQLKQLNKEWRRVAIAGQGDMNPLTMMFAPRGDEAYFTRGKVVAVGAENFLIAYRLPVKKLDFMALMRMGPGAQGPVPDKISPDTPLSLVLLNMRVVNLIGAISRFDLKEELARNEQQIAEARVAVQAMPGAGGNAEAARAASNSNLKQLALGALQYSQDFGEKFPPLRTAEEMKKALLPYVKNEALFIHPGTGEPYQPNPVLSEKRLASIAEPASMVLFYEMSAGDDGHRGVAYADGHVKRVSETEWPQIKKASRVP
jgi:prepilin-type processing-associated H-X9-DG protein